MRKLHKLRDLRHYSLHATDGEIGKVRDIYFDDRDWAVRYLVVRTGGWLLGRAVLIAPQAIDGFDDAARRVEVAVSREQVEASPPASGTPPVSRHFEETYFAHYGWQPYWAPFAVPAPAVPPPQRLSSAQEEASAPPNPHLRSSREITGYGIAASDGDIGNVEDVVLDDADWRLCFVEIDTHKWLPGKKLLLAPNWITGVEWSTRQVRASLPRAVIEHAPAYDPAELITPEYEVELFSYYSRHGALAS